MYQIIGTITPGGCFIMADDGDDDVEGTSIVIEDAPDEWREQLLEVMAEDVNRRYGKPVTVDYLPQGSGKPDLERNGFKAVDAFPGDPPVKRINTLNAAQCWIGRKVRELGGYTPVAKITGMTAQQVRARYKSYVRNLAIARGAPRQHRDEMMRGVLLVDNHYGRMKLGRSMIDQPSRITSVTGGEDVG